MQSPEIIVNDFAPRLKLEGVLTLQDRETAVLAGTLTWHGRTYEVRNFVLRWKDRKWKQDGQGNRNGYAVRRAGDSVGEAVSYDTYFKMVEFLEMAGNRADIQTQHLNAAELKSQTDQLERLHRKIQEAQQQLKEAQDAYLELLPAVTKLRASVYKDETPPEGSTIPPFIHEQLALLRPMIGWHDDSKHEIGDATMRLVDPLLQSVPKCEELAGLLPDGPCTYKVGCRLAELTEIITERP